MTKIFTCVQNADSQCLRGICTHVHDVELGTNLMRLPLKSSMPAGVILLIFCCLLAGLSFVRRWSIIHVIYYT